MTYRTNAKEEKQTSIDDKDAIHDLTNTWKIPDDDSCKCPFCYSQLHLKHPNLIDRIESHICSPNDRFSKGYFWWKKTCSIKGLHIHWICKTCKYHWIYKFKNIPNNPISEI